MTKEELSYTADIFIWDFDNAPKEFQELSENGGDEDWVALLTRDFYENHHINFLQSGTSFGCSSVDEYPLGEFIILIGCHA